MGFKYAKNTLAAGTQLGELTTLPRPLSRLGRGHQSQWVYLPMPHPPRRRTQRSICRGLGFNPPLVEDYPHTVTVTIFDWGVGFDH